MRRILIPVLVLLAAPLAGCFRATHLIYAYDLDIGIDVAYSQEGNARLVFGYDRGTYAVVPQREDQSVALACPADGQPPTEAGQTGELMSLAATSHVVSAGVTEFTFNHFVSTGSAAVNLAKNPNALTTARASVLSK
jgi:hypothetical protein